MLTATLGLSLLILVAGLLWLARAIWLIGRVSDGPQIGPGRETALLMIDLQTVFWDHGPYDQAAKAAAEDRILAEARAAKAAGYTIVALRQEWSIPSTKALAHMTIKGAAVAGSPGTELASAFADLPDDVVVKRVQDGFETGALQPLLEAKGVGRLRLVGLDTNYCVQKTALAARNRGYDVTVVRGGTLAAHPTDRAERAMAAQGVRLA